MITSSRRHTAGSALAMALMCAAVLSALGATAFVMLQTRYRVVHQTASWQEALLTAEGGVEMAMNEIRKELHSPEAAWADWARNDGDGSHFFTSRTLMRTGEGGTRSWAEVTVDTPSFLRDEQGEQWFRIRAAGIAEIPGGASIGGQKPDIALRKFDFVFNRHTNRRVFAPQATRMIEAIAKPVGAFRLAIMGTASIDMTDHNIVIDSYDSRDPAKSTNGVYDPAKRQENGDIATNGQLIDAGSAHIYGDAMTDGGTVLDADNVTGEIRDDFYQEVFAVTPPDVTPDPGTPVLINGSIALKANADIPTNYQFSSVSLSGTDILRITGSPDGSPTYCQIIISGNMSVTGQAQIIVGPGVFVRMFLKGDADVAGGGFVNPGSSLQLQIYGCDRPTAANGTTIYGNIKIAGNSGFSGALYAPTYDVQLKGGGSSDSIFGSFVGHAVTLTGVQSVHFDEAMADGGLVSDYKIVSWFEDER